MHVLGESDGKVYTPSGNIFNPLTFSKTVVQVSAGTNFCLLLIKNGSVYGLGSNEFGQLGTRPLKKTCIKTPLLISKLPTIEYVAAGECHSAVLSETGSLYVFGDNTCGQLGLGNRDVVN